MKYRPQVVTLLFLVSALIASAQSTSGSQVATQDTQSRAFWTDPSTALTWAGRDNGKDVSWKGAVKYCRDLRLAGYSDWRLAALTDLEGIYDSSANAPGLSGPPNMAKACTRHVKGNLFLTGEQWSSTQRMDDRGHPSGYAWRFNFNEGRSFGGDEIWFYTSKRALCVRGPEK